MELKMRQHGNTVCLVIPRKVLDLVNVQAKIGYTFHLTTNGKSLKLTPKPAEQPTKEGEQ